MGAGLAYADMGVLALHVAGDGVEAVGHLAFGQERLDYAQAAECLFDLRHGVGPEALGFEAARLEFTTYRGHNQQHNWREDQCKDRQFPRHRKEHGEVDDDQNRVLDQHVQRTGYRGLDFLDIAAHTGYDVALALLREETYRQREDFAVNLHAHVLDYAGAYRYHHRRRAEVAAGLDKGDGAEAEAEDEQNLAGPVGGHPIAYIVVDVVRKACEIIDLFPGNEFIYLTRGVEENLQNRYEQGEREYVEDRRQDIQQH